MADDYPTEARVAETGESTFAVDIEVSGHRLKGDQPANSGGGDTGPAPYDLLSAALAECAAMTIRWYAQKQGWPLEKVEVRVTHTKAGEEGKTDVFAKEVTLHGAELDDGQKRRLIEISAKCPVQRTLEGTPQFITK